MNDEDLRQYSEHLHYEIWMMLECFQFLQKHWESNALENAILESFLIHTREICAFLFGVRQEKNPKEQKKIYRVYHDDVIAGDYFDDPTDWKPRQNDFLDETYTLINKAIAHLTEKRLSEREQWDIDRIHNDLMPYLRDFRQSAPKAKLGSYLDGLNLEQIQDLSAFITDTTTSTAIKYSPIDKRISTDENDQ